MRSSGLRSARDYNRGLAPPVRWAHAAWAAIEPLLGPPVRWVLDPVRRPWALPLAAAAILFPIIYKLDPALNAWLTSVRLGGDVRREFEALQQFGQGVSTVLIALVIWLQDPARRRRLADWGAALVVAMATVQVGKLLVGRPRPKYDDPFYWLGPLGRYPVDRVVAGEPVGIRHAWEFWAGISSDLASMPSSHTCYAAITAVAVGMMYPRLRWMMAALAALVALGRLMTNAHWPTDVLVGAALGLAIGGAAMRGRWGQRALERHAAKRRRAADHPAPAPEAAADRMPALAAASAPDRV